MEVSFNLKLEFNYVLVNYQNPTVCKIKKTVSLSQLEEE